MALAPGQMQVRDLVMGPGTRYEVVDGTNPFSLSAVADQGGPRAWGHGTWSGAEWAAERVVPIRVLIDGTSPASWLAAHQQLAAAFAPIGDAGGSDELRWWHAGKEFILFGRPRMVDTEGIYGIGEQSIARCAFVAQDPRIYGGVLHTVSTGLPTQTGGLTIPFTIPFVISGVLDGGREELVNEGTTDTGLMLRIDGPVNNPRVTLQRPDGEVQRIRFDLNLPAGQWLDVDTAARTALLNGLPQANQRGRAAWDMDPYPVAPGTNVLRFLADAHNDEAELTASWRSAWW